MIKCISRESLERMRGRFERLYGADLAARCVERAVMLVGRYGVGLDARPPAAPWSERDALLIAYGDMVRREGEAPLATLGRFAGGALRGAFSMLHVLPFFPYSSDDGFAVLGYREVNPSLGDWRDIRRLGESNRLMVDLVLNHCSRGHPWFRDYVLGIDPYAGYFVEADPGADLSAVVRPRPSPLLHQVQTRMGTRWVWMTFGEDQVDLNFAEPDVLFELLDILITYIANGARIVRLDAVAFLWKEPGTSCVHLPQTHEVVKLIRDFLEIVAPDVILVTETNVPHAENVGYFGCGDEAHVVYQFSLPPLLLHGLLSGSARHLASWAAGLGSPPPGCAFLNFTASHDGIGVRPLEGLVPGDAVGWIASEVVRRGGRVSSRSVAGGGEAPYELNTTFYDALGFPGGEPRGGLHLRRFLCSQAIPMSLKGIPAFYFNSLLAAPNDQEGFQLLGYPRALNRRRWREEEAVQLLAGEGPPAVACREILRMLAVRSAHPAFHPDGGQRILDMGDAIFCVERLVPGGAGKVVCIHNMISEPVTIGVDEGSQDLLGGLRVAAGGRAEIEPYGVAWLASHGGPAGRNRD
ncbi:MAG TPA: sugar phosphorylase [Verrucomicrobiae bacterium]|nr:sugar phosphorylase [Verrucomicrobiae bacterium]